MWRCASQGVMPLYASTNPHVGGWLMNASSRWIAYERIHPLSSAIPFPVQRTAASRGEEHAPTTSGGRTFWNIPAPRMNQNRSCRRGIVAVGPQPRLSPQSVVIIRADNSSGSAQLNKGLASLRYTQPSSTPRSGTRKRTSSTPAQASTSRRPTHRILVLYYISA